MKKLWRRQKTGRFIPRPHMSRRSRGASRGAISVFLSIVLVPCIAFTSLFVDLSRVRLAKNLVESAGDLALNSLLTHYDFDLNDYYGLVASCQNIEEFYESSAGYFARMLKSQGLSDEESKTLISSIKALAGGDDVADLLQTEIKTDLAEVITPVADADLANPTVVKDQLVEFMKYRAPINITSNFLKELGDNSSALEHAKDDQELAEKKREYYEAENALMEKSYGIYVKLKAYQDLLPSEAKLRDIAAHLNSYREKFKKLHEAFVKDLFNTGSISEVRKTVYRLSDFYADDFDGETMASMGQLRSLITNTARAITSYKNAKTQLENAFPEYNSEIYDIQYWAQNYNAVILRQSALDSASSDLLTYFMKLENAFSYLSEAAAEGIYDTSNGLTLSGTSYAGYDGADSEKLYYEHYQTLYSQVTDIYYSVLSSAGNESSSDKYLKYIAIMQRISTARENKEAIDPAVHRIDGKTVNRTVMDIYSEISSDRASLKAFSDKLDGVAGTLNGLKGELREYKSAFGVWEDEAGVSVTEMGETDTREITDIKNGDTEAGRQLGPDEISEAGIDELKTRVTDMKALYDGLIAELDEMKYGSRKIKDITDAATAKSASGIRAASIKQTKSELDSYTDSSFSFTPAADPAVTVVLNATNAPDLRAPQNAMYGWMESKFADGKTDNKAAGDSKYKEYMSMGKDKANEEQTAEGVTTNNIAASGDAFGLGEGLGSIVDLAVGLAKDFGGELKNRRDSLFAAEYA
ncbi:MAG: taxilin, partial [Oscillospiraceae bacterium]|nr:taxilin [Oscillospiraceae bacterium]